MPIHLLRSRLRFMNFTQLEWTVLIKRFFGVLFKFIMLCVINRLNINVYSGLEIFSTFNVHLPVYVCLFHVRFNLTKSTFVNHRFGRSSTSSWQMWSSEKKSKLIFKKNILKTDNHSIQVIIIKCGTDSNIKVLNNANSYFQIKFLNWIRRVARKLAEFWPYIINKKITWHGCDTLLY